ncbi:WD repeat containing protein [Trema orientale]|uniref:WD repeat containing protein n=1 Tax=Trema orientale TaxID=63057 RepID=A0A2P5CIH9_TREOI|nr:WD repeat containing protein [Trema orientale]
MAQSNWEADKMLDVYIHDYLLKRKLHASAKAFMTEGKVATDPFECAAIDAPGGFLFEWWSVFWDIFIARTNEKHSEPAAAYIETQQIKAREQQQLQIQQLQLMQQRNAQLQRSPNNPALGGSINAISSEGVMGQPSASVLAMKMYEERMKHSHSMDSETSSALIDANRMALLKSATNHQGQLLQGTSGNIAALQQIHTRTPLATVTTGPSSSISDLPDIKSEVNIGAPQKSLPMDPSSIYGQAILQSKSGLGSAGLNQGVTNLPLKGWPLTGIDQLRPNLGVQVQKPNLPTQNQFLLASQQQQQQVLAQAQVQGNLGNSASYGDIDPRRFSGLPRGGSMNAKDGQSTRNEGSICSPVQSSSPKIKMSPVQHPSSQQDPLQQQQMQQNNRKRKQHSSSGPANSTGTGNTAGPSPSSPASTHTPGDGINTVVPKSLMMYGPEGTGGLASSSNLLEDIDRFGDVGSLEDNVESFLSNDGGAGDGRDIYGTVKQNPTELQKESSKVHNSPVMSLDFHPKKTELFCFCDHENEIHYWNVNPFSCVRLSKGGSTQVRFQPRIGNLLAAASDKVVSIVDVETDKQIHSFQGHTEMVNYICWEANGDYLASVSQTLVKIWSLATGDCIQELSSNGNQFHSCVFHPSYSTLLVIGGISSVKQPVWWEGDTRIRTGGHSSRFNTSIRTPNMLRAPEVFCYPRLKLVGTRNCSVGVAQ